MPKPSSALDTTSLVSAQYQGFFYGGGSYDSSRKSSFNWSSLPASFGFSSTLQSTCAAVVAAGTSANTSTTLDGGDFANNDPDAAQSKGGFGNCDFAIDFGTQDASNNGLYPNAMVWMGVGFTANTSKATYSFPAVAIAGKLRTKYAIFLIGLDSTQPWGIYLLQSN